MIKVNLLPVKRKKKAKPLPSFLLATIAVTVAACLIMGYLVFFFTTRLSERKTTFAKNETKIAELKEKIKAVEDFEKRNKNFKERNDIIEQLSKNRSVPARLLDELSSLHASRHLASGSFGDGRQHFPGRLRLYQHGDCDLCRQYKRVQTIYRGLLAGIKEYGA